MVPRRGWIFTVRQGRRTASKPVTSLAGRTVRRARGLSAPDLGRTARAALNWAVRDVGSIAKTANRSANGAAVA
jgi:hypothetical protein